MGIVGSVDWYVGVPLTLLGPEGYLGLGTTSYHINIKKTLIFEKIFKKKKTIGRKSVPFCIIAFKTSVITNDLFSKDWIWNFHKSKNLEKLCKCTKRGVENHCILLLPYYQS